MNENYVSTLRSKWCLFNENLFHYNLLLQIVHQSSILWIEIPSPQYPYYIKCDLDGICWPSVGRRSPLTWPISIDYHLPMKLWEGNIFSCVCPSYNHPVQGPPALVPLVHTSGVQYYKPIKTCSPEAPNGAHIWWILNYIQLVSRWYTHLNAFLLLLVLLLTNEVAGN